MLMVMLEGDCLLTTINIIVCEYINYTKYSFYTYSDNTESVHSEL